MRVPRNAVVEVTGVLVARGNDESGRRDYGSGLGFVECVYYPVIEFTAGRQHPGVVLAAVGGEQPDPGENTPVIERVELAADRLGPPGEPHLIA